jgi:hypothetical protein
MPALTVEDDVYVRLYLDADDANVRYDDNKINLRAQAPIPRRQIERMQDYPVLRTGGEDVKNISLSRRSMIINKRWYHTRH